MLLYSWEYVYNSEYTDLIALDTGELGSLPEHKVRMSIVAQIVIRRLEHKVYAG